MRMTRRPVPALARTAPVLAATILLWSTPEAWSQEPGPTPYRADCRTEIEGSRATAYCHNPYPVLDRIQLHVECARWWDVDTDSAPADVPPAGDLLLTDRCWKEVRSAWVSHQPVNGAPGASGASGAPAAPGG
ncbi:hypothetical protein ACFVIM_29445 [Streptomyces sp. NPDC057638]|uniref:hypothetical protein n=1 Tax=Streptomyces sp. NPDC057638 TaxID=3346190 RepID=UPI0036D06182